MAVVRLSLHYGNDQNLKGLVEACDYLPTLMTRGTKSLTRLYLPLSRSRTIGPSP